MTGGMTGAGEVGCWQEGAAWGWGPGIRILDFAGHRGFVHPLKSAIESRGSLWVGVAVHPPMQKSGWAGFGLELAGPCEMAPDLVGVEGRLP